MEMLNTEDLKKRWRKKSRKTVRQMVHRYETILKPMRIGREILIAPENVKKFEEQMRIYQEK